MDKIRNAADKFKKRPVKEKVKIIAAAVMSLFVLIAAPTLAWFSYQKQIATMAKIDSPAKLSLKSGAGEDIIQFKMSDIDTTQGNYKDFVFCVEGEDIQTYKIQLAHTTNINFTYSIYQATETNDTTAVMYEKDDKNGTKVYYEKASSSLPIEYINDDQTSYYGRTIGTSQYEEPSYETTDARQKFAEPLYWQTKNAITANAVEYDELSEDEHSFRNYYILSVSWGSDVTNDKETDLVYLTAQVAQ